MTVMRVERVMYRVSDLQECVRFFDDFGLERAGDDGPGARFMTQTGQVVELRVADDPSLPAAVEDGPTIREIVWGLTARRRWTNWRRNSARTWPTGRCMPSTRPGSGLG